jgi:membrane protease YdiL (CAAX protease family)
MLWNSHKVFEPGSSGLLSEGPLLKTRALVWAMLLFAFTFASMLASVFGSRWLQLSVNAYYVPPILVPIASCWIYTLLVHRFEARNAWELHIGSRLLPELALGFFFGGIFITLMWAVLCALHLYSARRGIWTQWFSDFVFDSYISAVVEELAFRAVLLRIFARLWGVRTAVLLSSLLFGLAHISHGSWFAVIAIAINGGITMALLYVITGRLWMSIGMHLGYDFVETSVLGVGSSHGFLLSEPRSNVSAWLSGGSFGPDAAVPAMILGVIINVWLWHLAFGSRESSGKQTQPKTSPKLDLV